MLYHSQMVPWGWNCHLLRNVINVLKLEAMFNIHHKCLLWKTSVYPKIPIFLLFFSLSPSVWYSLQISLGKPSGCVTSKDLPESHYQGSTVSNHLSMVQIHVSKSQQIQLMFLSSATWLFLFCLFVFLLLKRLMKLHNWCTFFPLCIKRYVNFKTK